jgi:hypothetical protein
MNKITILILIAAISGIGIAIVINSNGIAPVTPIQDNNNEYNDYGNGSGCCMEPPCKECFEKLGYCRCEEWEKNDECEEKSPDCGKNDSEVCELKHNQKV